MSRTSNIYHLGVKELRSLLRDPIMLVLIMYTFTLAIYITATAMPDPLNTATIAIVDEDGSPLRRVLFRLFTRHISCHRSWCRWPRSIRDWTLVSILLCSTFLRNFSAMLALIIIGSVLFLYL